VNLSNDDFIGIMPGVFSKVYRDNMNPLDFLSKERNLWLGAWLYSYYPDTCSADVLTILPSGQLGYSSHPFLMSAIYGDKFSIVDSVNGIMEDCEIEKFEIILSEDFYLSCKSSIKIGNVIPYDYFDEFKSKVPGEILSEKINLNQKSDEIKKRLIPMSTCELSGVSMYGIGDILSNTKRISIVPYGSNSFDKKAIINIYFKISTWGRWSSNIDGNISMFRKNTEISPVKQWDIPSVGLVFGSTYKFVLKNPEIKDISYVIIKNKKEKDKTQVDQQDEDETQVYCLKLIGDIDYFLNQQQDLSTSLKKAINI